MYLASVYFCYKCNLKGNSFGTHVTVGVMVMEMAGLLLDLWRPEVLLGHETVTTGSTDVKSGLNVVY